MMQYAVVEFDDSTMDIVGVNWLIGDGSTTYWPRKGTSTHQRRNSPPGQDWAIHKVNRILYQAMTFSEARRMLVKLVDTSDAIPSDEGGRGVKRKCIAAAAESSDDEQPIGERRRKVPAPRCVSPRPPSRLFEDDQQVVIPSSPATTSFPSLATTSFPSLATTSFPGSVVNLVPETSAAPFDAWVTKHEFEAYKKEHFSMLNKILVMQHNMEEMLVDLKRSTGAPSREPLPEGAPQLPLKTDVEVQQLEQWLLDKSNKCSLINYLGLVGGKNIEKATRNIMGHIFSKDVAPSFNWAGRGSKMAFSTLTVKDVVVSAALHHNYEQVNTISRVEEAIKMWLKAAKCRQKN